MIRIKPTLSWSGLGLMGAGMARIAVVVLILAAAVILSKLLNVFPHLGFVRELTVGGGTYQDADKLKDLRLGWITIPYQIAAILALVAVSVSLRKISIALSALVAALAIFGISKSGTSDLIGAVIGLGLLASAAYYRAAANWQHLIAQMLPMLSAATLALCHFHGLFGLPALSIAAVVLSLLLIILPIFASACLAVGGAVAVSAVIVLSAPVMWDATPSAGFGILDLLHVLAAGAVVISAIWTCYSSASSPKPVFASAAALVTATLSIAVLVAPLGISTLLPTDDYHFGEKLLAADATFLQGGWFTSFLSPHGLSDAAGAVIGAMIGDDSAIGILIGEAIYKWYATMLLCALLTYRLGAFCALLLMIVLPTEQPMVLMLTLNLVLGMEAMALRKPILAGALGAAVAALGVFLNAGPGAAAAVAIAVAGLVLHMRAGRRALLSFFAAGGIVSLIIIAAFWRQTMGQIDFLRISAALNVTIYGNGEFRTIKRHLIHFIYIWAPFLTLMLWLGRDLPPTRMKRAGFLILLCAPMTMFALVMNSYAASRLDDVGMRAAYASIALLIALPVWLAVFGGRRRAAVMPSALCAILGIATLSFPGSLREGRHFLPPHTLAPRIAIAPELPRLGAGMADEHHLRRILAVSEVVNALLAPEETFANFTNRTSFYFYLNRPNPVPTASPYNAAPAAFQRQNIAALSTNLPPLALIEVDNIEHDGMSLGLRSHQLYDFLLTNYQPFIVGDYAYGIRRDMVERLERMPSRVDAFGKTLYRGSYTDDPLHQSFAVSPLIANLLRAKDILMFSDGIERSVLQSQDAMVMLDRPLPAPEGLAKPITFTLSSRVPTETDLWSAVLHRGYLGQIPSAWGRSASRLLDEFSGASMPLTLLGLNDVVADTDQATEYGLIGADPLWVFSTGAPVSPKAFGLLELDVICPDRGGNVVMQVYWRSSNAEFSEDASVKFDASNRHNIVPLDASPLWSLAPDIAEVRIDIDDARGCDKIKLSDTRLLSRAH